MINKDLDILRDKRRQAAKKWRLANLEKDRARRRASERKRRIRKKKDLMWVAKMQKLRRLSYLKVKFGLVGKEAEEIESRRSFGCEVCKAKGKTNIDHCHVTGKTRGILCPLCNSALGYTRENIEVLNGLISYIKKHSN